MIFLNYRREDTAGHAGRLFDRLAARFGRGQVFMDVDTIQPGEDFANAITQRIGSCSALIVLIGDQWLTVKDRAGRPRLEDPADFVRLEILAALERGVPVIPVLVEGARMPQATELPEALWPLVRIQAMEISDTRFDAEAQDLVRVLGEKAGTVPGRRPTIVVKRRIAIAGVALIVLAPLLFLLRSKKETGAANANKDANKVEEVVDVSGRWRAEVLDDSGRTYRVALELSAAGGQLLGTVSYPTGVGGIQEGRIEGRRLFFTTRHIPQFSDQPATIRFAGEIVGNGLKLTMQSDSSMSAFVAHRVSEAEP